MRIRQFVMEFSDISLVNNIVEQIAFGENTLNTIAGKIGEKEPTVLYSLDKLITKTSHTDVVC